MSATEFRAVAMTVQELQAWLGLPRTVSPARAASYEHDGTHIIAESAELSGGGVEDFASLLGNATHQVACAPAMLEIVSQSGGEAPRLFACPVPR